jgi:hypothetical protein
MPELSFWWAVWLLPIAYVVVFLVDRREKAKLARWELLTSAESASSDSVAGIYWHKAKADEALVRSSLSISSDELVRRYVWHWCSAQGLPFIDLQELTQKNLIEARHKWRP